MAKYVADWKAIAVEAVKEAGRVALGAAIPIVLAGVQSGKVEWNLVVVAVVAAVWKAADKAVHEWAKDVNSDVKGVVPF